MRANADALERPAILLGGVRHDIVIAELPDLIGGDRGQAEGNEVADASHDAGDGCRQRHQEPLAVALLENDLHQLLEGEGLRPAQLIDRSALQLAGDALADRLGDIGDIDRLEPGPAAADQRQGRREPRHLREAVEKLVFRAEHDRRSQNDRARHGFEGRLLALRLGAGIGAVAAFVGPDGGDQRQSRAGIGRGPCDRRRPFVLQGVEGLLPRLSEGGDEVDDMVGRHASPGDCRLVADIPLDQLDLTDIDERQQGLGPVGMATENAHAIAAPGEDLHEMAAEKAGTAEYGDQGRIGWIAGHDRSFDWTGRACFIRFCLPI